VAARLRPEEALLFAAGAVLVALMAATGAWLTPTAVQAGLLAAAAALAALVGLRAYARERPRVPPALARRAATQATVRVARDFLPFVLALALYAGLHDLTPVLGRTTVDAALVALDRRLFGVDIARWLGQFAAPTLTAFLLACYLSFFFAQVILALILYRSEQRRHFREFVVSLSCVTVLGYAGYLLIPAVGPCQYQANLFPAPLPAGDTVMRTIHLLDALRGQSRDCFPSLHTAATACVLVFAWRSARFVFITYLPIALGLFISTLYLRYHYGVDVIAGFITALFASMIGPRIERAWRC
jgi:membrane-associated phospholipid phosphatase